jgi:hypothetical protein
LARRHPQGLHDRKQGSAKLPLIEGDLVELCPGARRHGDTRALPREAFGNRPADSASRAGDQNNSIFHHGLFSCCRFY